MKNLPEMQETQFDPWVRKIPSRKTWQPALVFLPGKFHGQRSLPGCGLWGCKELDITEHARNVVNLLWYLRRLALLELC